VKLKFSSMQCETDSARSDIKPGNILLSDDFLAIKIADFGLAHAISVSSSKVSSARGTPLFIAPELADNPLPSVLTDVFSFGMTAWQVLHPSVTEPFGGMPMVIMRKLDKGERPPFTRPDAPTAMKNLVARCLAHDPNHRPESMWHVHGELKAILQQLPDSNPPSTLAALLCQPALSPLPHPLPSGAIQLVDELMASDFSNFVRARVRREHAGMHISRICRVHVGRTRMATYLDWFMRESGSRSSNPMMRPSNPADAAFVSGLKKLKSLFERTSLGPSPPCNIVFAWHGTPAQHVEAVCRDGPRAFRTTDGGFFGAGSYFALELEYAARYAMMQVRTSCPTQPFFSHDQSGAIGQRRVSCDTVRCERGVCIRGHARQGLPC
jgi:serine/threonine protein kinase